LTPRPLSHAPPAKVWPARPPWGARTRRMRTAGSESARGCQCPLRLASFRLSGRWSRPATSKSRSRLAPAQLGPPGRRARVPASRRRAARLAGTQALRPASAAALPPLVTRTSARQGSPSPPAGRHWHVMPVAGPGQSQVRFKFITQPTSHVFGPLPRCACTLAAAMRANFNEAKTKRSTQRANRTKVSNEQRGIWADDAGHNHETGVQSRSQT
jgi:hypothetical protein